MNDRKVFFVTSKFSEEAHCVANVPDADPKGFHGVISQDVTPGNGWNGNRIDVCHHAGCQIDRRIIWNKPFAHLAHGAVMVEDRHAPLPIVYADRKGAPAHLRDYMLGGNHISDLLPAHDEAGAEAIKGIP